MPNLRKLSEGAAPGKALTGVMGHDSTHVVDFGLPPGAPFMCFPRPYAVSHADDLTGPANAAFVSALWNAYRVADDATRDALQTALNEHT